MTAAAPAVANSTSGNSTPCAPAIWRIVLILSLVNVVANCDRYVMSLLLMPIKQNFGLTDVELGLLQGTVFSLFFVAAIIPLGNLADRGNRRAIILGGLGLWSIGTVICAFSQSFAELLAGRALIGVGQAGLYPAALSIISGTVDGRRIGASVSIFTAAQPAGRSMALLIGGPLLAFLSQGVAGVAVVSHLAPWQMVFLASLAANLVAFCLLMTVAEPRRLARSDEPSGYGVAFRWLISHRQAYGRIFIGSAASALLVQAAAAWCPVLFSREFGLGPFWTSVIVGTYALVVGPLSDLTGGFLIDALSRRGIRGAPGFVTAFGLALSVPCAAVFVFSNDLGAALAGVVGMVFCLGLSMPAGLTGLQLITPMAICGRLTAIFVAAVTLVGLGIGPLMVGLLTDMVFGGADGLGPAIFVTVSCGAIIGTAAAWTGRPACSSAAEFARRNDAAGAPLTTKRHAARPQRRTRQRFGAPGNDLAFNAAFVSRSLATLGR